MHSEYVLLAAILQERWLCEYALMLIVTCTACQDYGVLVYNMGQVPTFEKKTCSNYLPIQAEHNLPSKPQITLLLFS